MSFALPRRFPAKALERRERKPEDWQSGSISGGRTATRPAISSVPQIKAGDSI